MIRTELPEGIDHVYTACPDMNDDDSVSGIPER
jgi:hypothetical protein